jgi:signal transduction histidine kinase
MVDDEHFQHLGGGRKGVFLLLRYVFIIAAAYLLIFDSPAHSFPWSHGVMIAAALASNLALSRIPPSLVFSWYVEAPTLIADTLWVSWAMHSTGTTGEAFFLLYFFVLCLAALGESLAMVLLGSTVISLVNFYLGSGGQLWTTANMLRVVFFYSAALFYGYVISQIKLERQRANRGLAWARELEAKVAERTRELQRLCYESQVASRVKSEFLSTISHELRTPLVAILGYTELILDGELGPPPSPQAAVLRRVHKRGRELLDLINATLDVSRLEAGPVSLAVRAVDLPAFMASLRAEVEAPGETDHVSLEWGPIPSLPAFHTDAVKLEVVLKSLIRNALKFTERGSVRVGAQPAGEGIEIYVSDTGIGIAAEILPIIFEPFRQGDGTDTRRHGGAGLGLYLVRRLVDLLGGRVTVDSHVEQGSTFRVWLPFTPTGTAAGESEPDKMVRAS